MPVIQGADRITLTHTSGSSAEILLYGATVISWKSVLQQGSEPMEHLFVSSKATLDGSKPVRGGIPIVFPCFGAPTHPDHSKLSQHGFARSSVWKWGGVLMDNKEGVAVKLNLESTSEIQKKYQKAFQLSFIATLSAHQLTSDLHVTNTASPASSPNVLEFQALFHTYIMAPSKDVSITPLQRVAYFDKTESTENARSTPKVEQRAGVDVRKFTDFVYENAPQKYKVTWPGGGIEVGSTNLKDLVIWNPQAEVGSKLSDMEVDGWERFVCVEPGYVRGFEKLEPGKTWVGQQVLSVILEV